MGTGEQTPKPWWPGAGQGGTACSQPECHGMAMAAGPRARGSCPCPCPHPTRPLPPPASAKRGSASPSVPAGKESAQPCCRSVAATVTQMRSDSEGPCSGTGSLQRRAGFAVPLCPASASGTRGQPCRHLTPSHHTNPTGQTPIWDPTGKSLCWRGAAPAPPCPPAPCCRMGPSPGAPHGAAAPHPCGMLSEGGSAGPSPPSPPAPSAVSGEVVMGTVPCCPSSRGPPPHAAMLLEGGRAQPVPTPGWTRGGGAMGTHGTQPPGGARGLLAAP